MSWRSGARPRAESGSSKRATGSCVKTHPVEYQSQHGAERTEFIASRFGHDLARMNTEVGTPRRRSQMQSANREQPEPAVAFEPVEQDQPEHEPPARAM